MGLSGIAKSTANLAKEKAVLAATTSHAAPSKQTTTDLAGIETKLIDAQQQLALTHFTHRNTKKALKSASDKTKPLKTGAVEIGKNVKKHASHLADTVNTKIKFNPKLNSIAKSIKSIRPKSSVFNGVGKGFKIAKNVFNVPVKGVKLVGKGFSLAGKGVPIANKLLLKKVIPFVNIGTGIEEVQSGLKEKNKGGAIFKITEGGASLIAGAAGVVEIGATVVGTIAAGTAVAGTAVAVGTVAATVGAVATVVGTGLYIAGTGNKRSKEMGLFKNEKGQNVTAVRSIKNSYVDTNKRISKKHGRLAGALAAHTAVRLQTGIAVVAMAGTGVAQTIRDVGNFTSDHGKFVGRGIKSMGRSTAGFVGKVGTGIANRTKVAGAKVQKLGDAAHNFGNKVDKKAKQLKTSKNLLVRTVGYAGAVGLSRASHFVGDQTKHLGKKINTLGHKIQKNTDRFVSHIKRDGNKFVSSARNTGHNIKTQARRLTTAIDNGTTRFVHGAQRRATAITNFVGSTTGNIVRGTRQNIQNVKQGVSGFVGNVNRGISGAWNSIWHH